MRCQIRISEENNQVILRVKVEEKNVWKKYKITGEEDRIKDGLREIIPYIEEYKKEGKNRRIPLPEESELILCDYPNLKHQPALAETIEKLKQIQRPKLKQTAVRSFYVALVLSVAAVTQIAAHAPKKEENFRPHHIVETDMDFTLLPLEDMESTVVAEEAEVLAYGPTAVDFVNTIDYIDSEPTLEQMPYQEYIPSFGTKQDSEKITYVKENYGEYTQKYAQVSGIDQEIIECLLAQERTIHSDQIDPGGAIGIAQIQYKAHIGETLRLRNEITGEIEEFKVTDELLKSLEGNIKTGVTILQNNLDRYQGNIFVALQAYNYGIGAMGRVLERASDRLQIPIDEILQNPTNLEWIQEVQEYKDGNYGDKYYLDHVLSRYGKETIMVVYDDLEPVELLVPEAKEKSPTY